MRGPQDVACSHCKQLGATQTCAICTLQVCEMCMVDPLTCSEPVGRVLTLGLGARMRAVDPRGQHALVTQPFRGLMMLDLRSGRWLGEVPIPLHVGTNRLALTDDGRVLYRQQQDGRKGSEYLAPVCMIDARTGAMLWRDEVDGPEPALLGVTPGQKYLWYTTGDLRPTHVRVWSPPRLIGEVTLLDRNFISAVAVDERLDCLVAGGSGVLAVSRLTSAGMEPALQGFTAAGNQVVWLGFAGDDLLTISAHPSGSHVERRELQPGLAVVQSAWVDGSFGCAAVSRDGAHLAISAGRTLHVFDLRDRSLLGQPHRAQVFAEHTDTISCVAFGADHVLVCGDDDRRVILRRRGSDGRYGRDLVPLVVPGP